jgi:hypothetical protein
MTYVHINLPRSSDWDSMMMMYRISFHYRTNVLHEIVKNKWITQKYLFLNHRSFT